MLAQEGFELIERHGLVHRGTPEQLVDALDGAWGVIAGSERYTAAVIDQSPSLRAIARPGVGVDAVDVAAASARGVAVLTTPGANDQSVADHTVGLILATSRRLVELDALTRSGAWRPRWFGRDLHGATVTIVGLGAIGRAVARRLAGFDCPIIAVDPDADEAFCRSQGIEILTLDEALPRSDVLTVHVPMTTATRHLIGARELGLLPNHALIVNTARGGVIDEAALAEAIEGGRVGGAALDVFEREPFEAGDALAALPNAILTPHHAAFTIEAVERMAIATADNLTRLARGIIPDGCINGSAPEVTARTLEDGGVGHGG